jgi:lysophospholipase L1-like esterase
LRFKIVATLVTLAAVGTALELGARSMDPQIPMLRDSENAAEIMIGHPTRLWAMSPGVRHNAGAMATIHASGLRGEVPEGPRASGEERILILGDSSFFGHGVEDAETMAVRLAAGLQDLAPSVRVINGAIPGYSSEQARAMMDDIGWDLEPTLLVIALLWSDNTWDLFRDGDLLKTARTFYKNPLARSRFYQMLAGAIDRARGGTGAHIVTWTQESEWPDQGVRRVDVHRFATNMDHLVVEAARRGAGVVFVAPVNVEMVNPRRPGESFSWTMYFDAQAAVAAHYSVPVVTLLPPFRAAFEQASGAPPGDVEPISKVFLDKMHPTPFGHQLMADGVIAALEAADWPTNRLLGMQGPAFDTSTIPADSWGQPPGELEKTLSPHGRLYSESPPQYR